MKNNLSLKKLCIYFYSKMIAYFRNPNFKSTLKIQQLIGKDYYKKYNNSNDLINNHQDITRHINCTKENKLM